MKKWILIATTSGVMLTYATDFVSFLGTEQNDYKVITTKKVVEISDWTNKGDIYNCGSGLPAISDIYEGKIFTQTETCSQEQVKFENTYVENLDGSNRVLISQEEIDSQIISDTRDIQKTGIYEALSCLDALNHGSSTTNGDYLIKPKNNKITAYCDMTNGGYTQYKLSSQSDQLTAYIEAACEAENLQLFVPRTEAHLTNAVKTHGGSYFTLMGIYPKVAGATCNTVYLNSSTCNNWQPKNGGKWFVYDWDMSYPHSGGGFGVYPEPNGDNSLNSSMIYGWDNTTGRVTTFNDIVDSSTSNPGGYKTTNWTCSAKDESNI